MKRVLKYQLNPSDSDHVFQISGNAAHVEPFVWHVFERVA